MTVQDPILSPDGKFWIDATDGRTVPVVRGGDGPEPGDPPSDPAAPETGAPAPTDPASDAPEGPDHGFATVDDAVAALKETRAEAAARRVEAKELKGKVEKFDTALAGYKPEEIDYLLEMFHDLSDPKAQKRAAKELSEIAAKVLDADGPPVRPTGEEDPDEKPLTKKEWERLEAQKDQTRAQEQALKQLESEATDKGYPPDSPGYTVLLSSLMEPDVAGDMDKAVAKVEAYEQAIVEKYRTKVTENADKWPGGAPPSAPNAPGDPDAGVPVGWGGARKAAAAYLAAKAGKA
jgi:hypothetical protein